MNKKGINPIYSNFTLAPSISGGQKFGTSYMGAQEEERAAEQQGFWDSSKNILGRLVGRAGLSVLETGAMLGYGLPKAAMTGNLSSIFSNEITDGFKFLDEKLREATPFYQTEAEKKASLFSTEYLSSTNFWGNVIGEGGGFLLGAAATGRLLGAGVNYAVNRGANTFGRLATSPDKVVELGESLKTGGSKFFDKFMSATRSDVADNTAKYYMQRVAGNLYEASVEARGVKDQILQEKERKWREEHPNMEPPEAVRAEWNKISDLYGNVNMGSNLAILMLDGYGFDRFLKGYTNTNRTVNALINEGKYIEKGKFGKIVDRARTALAGPMTELGQEGAQFFSEKTLTDLAMKEKEDTKLNFNDYVTSVIKGLEETFGSKEGQESMLAGFLLAAPFNATQAINEGKLDREGIQILNSSLEKDAFQKIFQHNVDIYNNNFGEKKDEAAINNSHFTHENLVRDHWFKHVKSRDDAGRFDDISDEIYRQKSIPLSVFNELHNEEYTEAQRQKQLNDYENQAKYYKKLKENFDTAYTKHPNRDAMLEASFHIQGTSDRINELRGKLTNTKLDVLTKERIAGDIQLLEENKLELEKKLFSLLKGEEYISPQKESIPNDGELVSINNTTGIVEGRVPPPPPPPNIIVPPSEEETEKKAEGETEGEKPEEETVLRVSTSEGPIEAFPHEIEEDYMEDENLLDSPEESLFTEVNNPTSEFTEDIPRDLKNNEKGKSLVIYEKDADGNTTGNIAQFSNYTDFNVQDHEVNYNQAKNIKVDAKQLAQNRAAKSLIIDNNEILEFNMIKQKNGDSQLIGTDKNGNDYDLGYFLNPDETIASRVSKINPEMSMTDFVSNYKGAHSDIAETLLAALSNLTSNDSVNITDYIRLSSVVDNVESSEPKTLLRNIFASKYANRWLIDGEFVVAMNNNGNYVAIDGLSKEKQDLLYSQLENSKALNSLGTQYVALVKRPDSNAYQFIGLKGRQHNQADIDGFKSEIDKYAKNTNLDIKNLVNNLNDQIFIPSNKTAVIDGKEVPLHFKFAFKKNRELIVIGVPKIINGVEQNVKLPRVVRMTVDEALAAASVRIGKTTKEALDKDSIIQNTVTNAKPEIWRTFFSFNSREFLNNLPQQTSNIIETPTTDAVEEVITPVSDVEAKKADIERRRQEELKSHEGRIQVRIEVWEAENEDGETEKYQKVFTKDGKWELRALDENGKNLGTIDRKLDPSVDINKVLPKDNWRKVGESDNVPSTISDKINARYDAELAALEGAKDEVSIAAENARDRHMRSNVASRKREYNPIASTTDPRVITKLEEVRKAIKEIVNVDVKFFDSDFAYGAFTGSVILLNRGGWQRGTEWHEAFHAVFSLFSQQEQKNILSIAYKKLGVTQDEIDALRTVYAKGGEFVDNQFLFEKVLEEKVADMFQDYMNGRPTNLFTVFFEKFKNFIRMLFNIVEKDEFKALFKNIEGGKYAAMTPSGEITSYSLIDGASALETNHVIRYLTTMYLNREEIDKELGTESRVDLKTFISAELEKMRNNSAKINNERIAEKTKDLNNAYKNNLISQKGLDDAFDNFYQNLSEKNIKDERGRVYSAYLSPENEELTIAQVIRHSNLRRVEEVEEDDEIGENRDFSASELEKSPQDTKAAQFVKDAMSALYYIKEGEVIPLNYIEVFNNLLLNLSGISNKTFVDPVTNKLTDSYEQALLKLTRTDSDLSLSIKSLLNLYNEDTHFKNNFRIALQRSFTNAYNIILTSKTLLDRNFVKNANNQDYTVKQVELWKSQILSKKINGGIVPNGKSLYESIGIVIEPDTLIDEEAIEIVNRLSSDIRGLKDKIIITERDEDNKLKNKFNASILDRLTKLAEINIKNRLDLGELNFKNAKGKSMHSMMQNSWVLNKLRGLGVNFGIFTGNNFNGDRMDYNDLDPKKYFETLIAMYLNTSNGKQKPFFTIQQFEAKSTVPVFEGVDYSDISEEDFKTLINDEKNRQDINFLKVKGELTSRTRKNLVEGYHYFQSSSEIKEINGEKVKVKLPAPRKIMDKYKELTGNEFTNYPTEIAYLVNLAEEGQLERDFLPRGFRYTNLPYFNEVKNPQYTKEAFEKMFAQQTENLKQIMLQFNITFNDLKSKFNIEQMTEAGLLNNFIKSNYLNKMKIIGQISPDLNQFKDFTDITKRGAGLLASGPNHGEGTFNFAIVPDSSLDFIANGKKMSAEELDAQGMETIKERMNRLERLGVISRKPNTKNPKSDAAYQRYLILQAYLNDDREFIENEDRNHDAVLKVDKTVGYGEEFYIKTAVYVSTRYFHSREVKEGTEGAFKDIDNGKSYLPMPGREYEWNLMNEMQTKGISSLFAKSAVKKGARSIAEEIDGKLSLSTLTFNYEDYRLQQENPSGKVKIKDGTQLRQLLEAGFDPYYKLDDGRNIESIIEISDKLLSEITRFNTMLYGENKVYDVNGKKINPFTTYLKNSLENSASTDRMLEFFESKEGQFEYSPSMPMMKIKFEELLLAYFNNNVASQKTPGLKSTIISSKYYKTMELNGKVITSYEYNNLPERLKKEVTIRDLNYSNPQNKLSEIVLSEEYLDNLGITIKEWVDLKRAFEKAQETKIETEESRLFDKISTILCYRIPTQAQQSMMPARVIDFLPRHYGSTAIPPAQITKMSGADYDVDSIFIHRHAVYRDKNGRLRSYDNGLTSLKKSLSKNNFISDMVKEVENPVKINLEKELSRAESRLRNLKRELAKPYGPEGLAIKESILMELKLQRDRIKLIETEIEELGEGDAFTQVMGAITGKTNMPLDDILASSEFTVVEKNFNDVLDNRIAILTSDKGIELLNSPAEDLFKDIYQEYFKDIFGKKDNYPVYSGADTQFIEWLKVAVGSKSIGGSANINKISGFLVKNNIPLTVDFTKALKRVFDLDFSSNNPSQTDIVLEKNGKRVELKYEQDKDGNFVKVTTTGPKSDLLSSNVTLSVDNAKDQRLIEFNLNDKNMGHASTLASLGFGTNRLATLLLNPITKLIASNLQLNAGFGKEYEKVSSAVESIFSGIPKNPDITSFTDEDLIDGINSYDEMMDVLQSSKAKVIIESDPWEAQKEGKGISVIRGTSDKHYGNPFGAEGSKASVIMPGTVTDRVNAFRKWLNGTEYQEVEPARREWMLSQINGGKLDGKNLIYYKPLGEQSHADVIAEMVNFRKLAQNPELLEKIQKQMAMGSLYQLVGAITDDNFTINTVLNFNKEVGKDGSDITKIQFALQRMLSENFSYETGNIFSNPVIEQVRATCLDLKRNVSQQLLSYNYNVIRHTNDLLNCTSRTSLEQKDNLFQKDLNDKFIEYLGMKAYNIYKPVVNLMTPSTVVGPDGNTFEETFSIQDKQIINGNKVIAEYERVLEYMTAMKFPIASLLSIQEPTDRYPFRRLGINTFTNLSSEDKQKLVDSFDELLIDPNTETLGKYIITHIAAHDNFKYIANSLVDKARPMYFTSLNRIYKGMQEFDGMEQIFSMNQSPESFLNRFESFFQGSMENYLYDFGKFFFSDIKNSSQLKGPEASVMTAVFEGDNKPTAFSINKEKNTYFFNIPTSVDRETIKFPYFFRTGKTVHAVYSITDSQIIYAPLPIINSKKSVALKLYQLDYNDYVNFINATISNKPLEDDTPIVQEEPQVEVVNVKEPVSEDQEDTTGDIPEVTLPTNRTKTNYKYFGAYYNIILEDGKGVDVEGYLGKVSAKQKLLNAFNLNPDVDPQNGKNFRDVNILGGINFQKIKQEPLGLNEYELFPRVFANEGQKVAIDKIKSYLTSDKDEFLLKGRGGTGKTTIIRKALEPFKTSKIIGATVSDEARGILQENMKAYDTYTIVSMLGLVADNDQNGEIFFRERNEEEQEKHDNSSKKDPIENADIVIIDEASMIDRTLYDLIMKKKKRSSKIIFMGDNAQIAPIEGGESPIFDLLNTEDNAVLTERMRQVGESPILPITDVFADNIENLQNNRPGVKNPLTNRVDTFNSADNEGVLFINSNKDLINMFVKDFETDPGFKTNIIVAATNKIVDAVSNAVRKEIFGDNVDPFVEGDIVRLNSAYVVDGQKIYSNGTKGKVTSVVKEMDPTTGFIVYRINVVGEKFSKVSGRFEEETFKFTTISPTDKASFKQSLNLLAEKARTKEISWRQFYAYKESIMDVGYNYALTSHKVQGSTYRNVYVVEDDIMSFPDNIERINRMMYTAVSRPSKKLVIYSTKNPKTNIISDLINKVPTTQAPVNTFGPETKINIYAGTGENPELSNFAIRPFTHLNIKFDSVEQAYQFYKSEFSPKNENNKAVASVIKDTTNGKRLRELGKEFKGLDQKVWDSMNSTIMKALLKDSFEQNPDAFAKLLATGNATLTHTQDNSKWKTEFPRLLMEVRDELKGNQPNQVPVTPQANNLATTQVIDKILANFEEYKDRLDALNIFSKEELQELSPEEKDTLVQKLCNI